MGHFFRALNIVFFLKKKEKDCILTINYDKNSIDLLEEKRLKYIVLDYDNLDADWAKKIVEEYDVSLWILDMFETNFRIAQDIKKEEIYLAAIDDRGSGAEFVDFHFCGMLYGCKSGHHIYEGKDYLILNSEIDEYKRVRKNLKKIIVTLGGSDTYGVTVKVIKILKKLNQYADIVVGPNFSHMKELQNEICDGFNVFVSVPSLIKKMSEYDLAITGGGVTCFEANAMGLPAIIIANELHEIGLAKYLEGFGGAIFAGYYENIDESVFDYALLDIKDMSQKALNNIDTKGLDNIYKIIEEYI